MINTCFCNVLFITTINSKLLLQIKNLIIKTPNNLFRELTNVKIINLPTNIKKLTLIRSPHINKKSKEQFEIRKYKLMWTFFIKKKLIKSFSKIFKTNIPSGVFVKFQINEKIKF